MFSFFCVAQQTVAKVTSMPLGKIQSVILCLTRVIDYHLLNAPPCRKKKVCKITCKLFVTKKSRRKPVSELFIYF